MKHLLSRAVSAAAFSLIAVSSQAATADFSGYATGAVLTNFDFGNGLTGTVSAINNDTITVNDPIGSGEVRIFDTTGSNTFDPDLENPFTNSLNSNDQRAFGNALIIQAIGGDDQGNPDDEASGGVFTFNFDQAIDLISFIYLDGEEGADVTTSGGTVGFGSGVSGDNNFVELFFNGSANGITSFTVTANGSGAIGGFEATVSAVPLPAGLPLMAGMMGAFGLMGWRRKKAA